MGAVLFGSLDLQKSQSPFTTQNVIKFSTLQQQ